MADENNNVDLSFLAEQSKRILKELGEIRENTKDVPQIKKDVAEIQIAVTAMRTDQNRIAGNLDSLGKTVRSRLNAIDHRIADLEERADLTE